MPYPHVQISDVILRDGLQLVRSVLPTEDKKRIVDGLYGAGLRHLDITSFVPPARFPQFADASDIVAHARRYADLDLSAFAPNPKGAERAAALGVTSEAISEAVRVATNGDYSASMAKLNLTQRKVAIRVRLDPENSATLDDIANRRVAGTNGSVDLGSIADIRIGSSPSEINRIDRSRNITLSIELNGRALGDVNGEAQALPALKELPQEGPADRAGRIAAKLGAVRELRHRHGYRCTLHLRCAGTAIPRSPAARDDPDGAAAVSRGRPAAARPHRRQLLDTRGHRAAHADGRGDEELRSAG